MSPSTSPGQRTIATTRRHRRVFIRRWDRTAEKLPRPADRAERERRQDCDQHADSNGRRPFQSRKPGKLRQCMAP